MSKIVNKYMPMVKISKQAVTENAYRRIMCCSRIAIEYPHRVCQLNGNLYDVKQEKETLVSKVMFIYC